MGKKRGRRRTKDEIQRDRARIAKMYLRGYTQAEIGEEIGFDQSQISYDLQRIREDWQESALRDFDEAAAEELAKIDDLERTYWQAWEKSLEAKRTTRVKQKGAGGEGFKKDKATERMVKSVERLGDPRYLKGVERCIERRCTLMGLDAPERHEHSGPGGSPIQTASVSVEEWREKESERMEKVQDMAAAVEAAQQNGEKDSSNDGEGDHA